MERKPVWRALGLPVYVALALLVVITAAFLLEIFTLDNSRASEVPAALTADSYKDRMNALLANANPDNARAALVKYDCVVCHETGAPGGIAPAWDGLGERAAGRRPPLTAAAYVYESILYPAAYVVEGYAAAMPQNYRDRVSDAELGDIIVYLLQR